MTTYKQYAKVDESSEQRRQSQIRTVFRKNEKVQKTLKKLEKVLDKEKRRDKVNKLSQDRQP